MNREIIIKIATTNEKSVKHIPYSDPEILWQWSNISNEVPDDIVVEILSRLPVKSVCRFKCISKIWCNRLSESQFVNLHLKETIKANRLTYTLYDNYTFPRRLELDYESLVNGREAKPKADASLFVPDNGDNLTGRWMQVWGSCNGLLCIFSEPDALVLANPSTRETKTIFFRYDLKSELFSTSPNTDTRGGGFGYDDLNNDHKVVKVNRKDFSVDVYSLKKDSWSCNIGKLPENLEHGDYISLTADRSAYMNGAIHWIGYKMVHRHLFVTVFDLNKEKFFHIPTPIRYVDFIGYDIHSVEGCLCITPRYSYKPEYDLWVMEKYGVKESWKNVKLSFSYSHQLVPLFYPSSEEALGLTDGRLFLYNNRNGSLIKEVNIGPIPPGHVEYFSIGLNKAFTYVESLVSLGSRQSSKSRKRRKD
ncbi:hypothetical protein COLO4_32395 [Corchorus olitorius]|uniref:F-box domain-containing protein n=1 Tax=Corchorus olitorius TaxID=93759 RepID=A0A1R3GZG3_9ROSI|nr:hypothetical protein COLO4_32395 [Corchorus olitorius]